jgi:chaperonin GroES
MERCILKPNGSRLVIEYDTFKYSGSLVIPERAKVKPTTGIVIATGEGLEQWLGKRVLFGMYSGTPVKFHNRQAWLVCQIEEVIAEVESSTELDDQFKPEVAL